MKDISTAADFELGRTKCMAAVLSAKDMNDNLKNASRIGLLVIFLATALRLDAATLTIFAGGGMKETGLATECRLADPFACEFDAQGNAYICEMTNNRVVKVDSRGNLSLFAGTTKKGNGGDGGVAAKAELNGPHNLVVMKNGDVLIGDTFNWKIRRVDAQSGLISTFAGTGARGFSGDGGAADKAQFSGTYSLAFDPMRENLYIADLENRRVRAINLESRLVRTVAGNGQRAAPTNGADAATSPLLDPRAVAVSASGDIYVLERGGNVLRVIDAKGKMRTVVGAGKPGPWTPNERPLEVTLRGPKHLAADRDGSILIADSDNDVIRRYSPKEDRVTLVVGTGRRGGTLSRDPLKTELRHPHGVSVDGQGNIYISDSYNSRVLKIQP
jgi:DNA-binding beta-propeller fold protein YncE